MPLRRPCLSSLFSDYDPDIAIGYLFELLRWQNLTRLHEIDKVTVVYKSLEGLAPEYLCSRFTTRELANNPRNSLNKVCTINMDKLLQKQF